MSVDPFDPDKYPADEEHPRDEHRGEVSRLQREARKITIKMYSVPKNT
jgi:hypothetical protein